MAKQAGLLMNLAVAGYDLSGDVGVVDTVSSPRPSIEVTGMDKLTVERLQGLGDGKLGFTSWWNIAAGQSHPVLSALPTTDVVAMLLGPALPAAGAIAVGDPAACIIGKQLDYAPSRQPNGALSAKIEIEANALGLQWGDLLTTGKQTFASSGTGTALDGGTTWAPPVVVTSSSVASPTHIVTATAHGLLTGDTVLIAGHSGSTPALDGHYQVTRVNDTEYTVPVNVSSGGTGGTSTRTSTHHGASAYLQAFSIGSGSATVAIQDSADNSSFTNVSGLAFTAIAAAPTTQVLTVASPAIVRRYVKLNVTGTFTNLVVAVALCRYYAAI